MSEEKFHYETPGGEIVIPKYKHLKSGLIRRLRRSSPADQIFTALEEVAGEKELALVDDMTQEQMNDFVAAWQKDSGITTGE